jgi:hypothetical protein
VDVEIELPFEIVGAEFAEADWGEQKSVAFLRVDTTSDTGDLTY